MSMLRMISATDLVAPSRVGSAKILRPVTLITESGEKVELSPMGAKWLRDVLRPCGLTKSKRRRRGFLDDAP